MGPLFSWWTTCGHWVGLSLWMGHTCFCLSPNLCDSPGPCSICVGRPCTQDDVLSSHTSAARQLSAWLVGHGWTHGKNSWTAQHTDRLLQAVKHADPWPDMLGPQFLWCPQSSWTQSTPSLAPMINSHSFPIPPSFASRVSLFSSEPGYIPHHCLNLPMLPLLRASALPLHLLQKLTHLSRATVIVLGL